MYKLFFLILFSVSSLVALSPSRIAIGFNPAYITPVDNARNVTPDTLILLVEEELTKSNCSKDSKRSYVLTNTENPEEMKKYRETIEKDKNDEMIDPDSRNTPHFIVATHLLKGSAAFNRGCAMVNLRIEDRKGCIIAQKKISVSGIRNPKEILTDKLIPEAVSSLRYQICNSKTNEQTCSKSHYTDKLSCPYYFIITTTLNEISTGQKNRGPNTMLSGPKVLTSTSDSSTTSKQLMYVNPSKGVVTLLALKDEAKSHMSSSFYQLNHKSCQYEEKTTSSTNEHLNDSLAVLKHHSIGLGDNSNAQLTFGIRRSFKNKFKVNWETLRTSGSWSQQYSESKNYGDEADMPEEVKKLKNIIMSGIEEGSNNHKKMSETILKTLPLGEKEKCHVRGVNDLFSLGGNYQRIDDVTYSMSISPATQSEIKLFKSAKDTGAYRNYSGSKPPVKKISHYEKEPTSLFDALQNSTYNQLSKSEKKAWDRTLEVEQEKIDSKKSESEFDDLSIDDLEMFSK